MNRDKKWLYIAVLALVLAVCWVEVSAVEKLRTSTLPADLEKVMTPLDPNLDQTIFTKLAQRKGGG